MILKHFLPFIVQSLDFSESLSLSLARKFLKLRRGPFDINVDASHVEWPLLMQNKQKQSA